MKHLALILALLIPQMAMARIGETVEQCDARYGERYGKPQEHYGLPTLIYHKGIYFVIVGFIEGKCVRIEVLVGKLENVRKSGKLGPELADEIVKRNCPDIQVVEGPNDIDWRNEDGDVRAGYSIAHDKLLISTRTARAARVNFLQQKEQQSKEKPPIDGF